MLRDDRTIECNNEKNISVYFVNLIKMFIFVI